MFHSWLDRWDERRAARGDADKPVAVFALGADLPFPGPSPPHDLDTFCARAEGAAEDPAFFAIPAGDAPAVVSDENWIRFPSAIRTETERNDTVWTKVTEARASDHALIVFHHWNAQARKPSLARFFTKQGITVVEIAMPYHLERSRPGALHADDMLGANLGRTLRSMRQAVLDGRQLIAILRARGYARVSVLGMSLGSWVAGLVAAHDRTVERAALFLTAGSLADMVWTGRATRHIRASLEGEIALPDLRRAWAPLDLAAHADALARPELGLQIVLARRDTVVLPDLSDRLVARLEEAGARMDVMRLNCGHYSLSLPPYVLQAGLGASRLLKRDA